MESNVSLRILGIGDLALPSALTRLESRPRARARRLPKVAALACIAVVASGLVALDLRTSWAESLVCSAVARHATFAVRQGQSRKLARPGGGPYDERLGYVRLAALIGRLNSGGFQVRKQSADSFTLRALSRLGIDPIYREKNRAGLLILDRAGRPMYDSAYPRRIYPDFAAIPPLIVKTVLFIENREMLDTSHPYRNPAVQWGRFGHAIFDVGFHAVDRAHARAGGSTLATQIEKMRHSPDGRTDSIFEKARQMASASLRAYAEGPATLRAQREIVCRYINSIPLSATQGQGEITGLEDGLHDWYEEEPSAVNALLEARESDLSAAEQAKRGRAYREVLSLLLALRAPTRYLSREPERLADKTDGYLRLLYRNGVISARLRDYALESRGVVRPRAMPRQPESFTANKASSAIRVSLLKTLRLKDEYVLDRLDMTARTTLDRPTGKSVNQFLAGLSDANAVKAAGLDQYQLLDRGNPGSVIYSVTVYQPGPHSNLLRIQTDNFNQPLDINDGTKLQLGSTAKLRTMINYLQIVEDLHRQYATLSPVELKAVQVIPGDNLTRWALDYLSQAEDKGLEPMLQAALARKYSGGNGEAFFTAGGLHHFDNFETSEDYETMTVSEAFQRSVNLVFIRLMRDIERYYMFRVPGASPTVLTDENDPARRQYIERFADFEGRTFLRRFYEKYRGQTADQSLQTLLSGMALTPVRAAVIFRSIRPQADVAEFQGFLRAHLPGASADTQELFDKYGPDKFDLNDRGYLAHVHPLELWLLRYRERHANATLADVFAASTAQRQEVYSWLFKTRYKHAQDKRIETLLEIDAFKQIHRAWKSLGYPFDSLVPSYATSIGVSGDTPHALAVLAGILLHDGVHYPDATIQQISIGERTPWETRLEREPGKGVRVLSPIIARLVRAEMVGVVQNGTGRRAQGGFRLSDGSVLPIGGKTGTGDNRLEEFGIHGGLIGSHVQNRTAAFVFFIGDRLYGTVLAFVPGKSAGNYKFTSALAVQILKDLEPRLLPLIGMPVTTDRETSPAG